MIRYTLSICNRFEKGSIFNLNSSLEAFLLMLFNIWFQLISVSFCCCFLSYLKVYKQNKKRRTRLLFVYTENDYLVINKTDIKNLIDEKYVNYFFVMNKFQIPGDYFLFLIFNTMVFYLQFC